MFVADVAEQPRKFSLMRGENDLRVMRCFNRFEQTIGRLRKTCQCVGIEHQAALRRQRRNDKVAGPLAKTGAGPDHARVESLVAQQLGKLDHGVDRTNHYGGYCRSIHRERIAWRGQRDEAGPGTQRPAR